MHWRLVRKIYVVQNYRVNSSSKDQVVPSVKVLKFTSPIKLCKENICLNTLDAALAWEPTHYPTWWTVQWLTAAERRSLCNFKEEWATGVLNDDMTKLLDWVDVSYFQYLAVECNFNSTAAVLSCSCEYLKKIKGGVRLWESYR